MFSCVRMVQREDIKAIALLLRETITEYGNALFIPGEDYGFTPNHDVTRLGVLACDAMEFTILY